jgi:hypothetical protein
MRLLNVRLDDDDARIVKRLRERGISISTVVRKAIRSEAGRAHAEGSFDPVALLAEMKERFPRPPEGRSIPRIDATDRRQVARLIQAKLRGRR